MKEVVEQAETVTQKIGIQWWILLKRTEVEKKRVIKMSLNNYNQY